MQLTLKLIHKDTGHTSCVQHILQYVTLITVCCWCRNLISQASAQLSCNVHKELRARHTILITKPEESVKIRLERANKEAWLSKVT